MTLIICVVLVALVFEYINGFHDTANAIATSVSTRVMTPRQAIAIAALGNLFGALAGTQVAKTVGAGLVDGKFVTLETILCALLGAIIWNLLTWWVGLPSSSSHALIGGLCGATLANAHGKWSVIHWNVVDPATQKASGLWPKVVMPMFCSPVLGFIVGFLLIGLLLMIIAMAHAAFKQSPPVRIKGIFTFFQWISAGWMSFSHGTNDAQKTMGIIALSLYTGTKAGSLSDLPGWLSFLHTPEFTVHTWTKVICAITIAAGTAAGGWRIITTLGSKLVKMQPIHGFAAQTTAAGIIHVASAWGIPLSTTHVISASIMGVGASRGLKAVKWRVVERMVWAWILTLPITAGMAYGLLRLAQAVGWVD